MGQASKQATLDWWQGARFGMFIHWGPISLLGREISWSRGDRPERKEVGSSNRDYPGWDLYKGIIPPKVYDNLYKSFYPSAFDASEWVDIAQAAGMKYLVFTCKHHDGFCNFDSKLTDHKITSPESPFRRDIVKEIADACHRQGMPLGLYYSQPDWHHPDYLTDRHERYVEYLHGQVRELCTNYGEVKTIWFDGLGHSKEDWNAEKLFDMIRSLQPGILINDRAGLAGDYYTPEQRVGSFDRDRPWESCITIGDNWNWRTNDNIKSLKDCLRALLGSVGGDGNLLFNVGPMPTGAIEPRQVDRLKEMGDWLSDYGDSVYETRGGPCKPGPWGVSTHKDDIIYLHVFGYHRTGIALPGLGRKITSSRLLTGGKVSVEQGDSQVRVTVSPQYRQEIDTIVELRLDGPAGAIEPMDVLG
jgi:alpha-L-fucosidase